MNKFTPDDLKNKYPGKYDDWKFAQNGKDEWVGFHDKELGVITSKKNKSGELIPFLQKRETEALSPSVGVLPYMVSKSLKKNKQAKKLPLGKIALIAIVFLVIMFILVSFL